MGQAESARRSAVALESIARSRASAAAALSAALEALKKSSVVKLYTDSKYLQQGVHEWMAGWKKKGWPAGCGLSPSPLSWSIWNA
jgi:ribonuclease HI